MNFTLPAAAAMPTRVRIGRSSATYAYVVRDMAGNVIGYYNADWQVTIALEARGYSREADTMVWSR